MLKQNLFIILSGILAGAAVMGWMRPTPVSTDTLTEPGVVSDTAEPASAAPANIDLTDASKALDASNSAALKILADAAVRSDLAKLQSGPKRIPKVKLVSPDATPAVDPEFIEVPVETLVHGIVEALRSSDDLKDATSIAVVDLSSGNVIAETEGADAKSLVNLIQGTDFPASGALSDVRNDIMKRWAWHCIDDSGKVCLASAQTAPVALDGPLACQFASPATRVVCGTEAVSGQTAFSAQNCDTAQFNDISALTQDILKAADSGSLGDMAFAKKDIGYGCTLISAIPAASAELIAPSASALHAGSSTSSSRSLALTGILAIGSAILVILIGIVCTKRRREETQELSQEPDSKTAPDNESDAKIQKLQDDLQKSKKEVESLKESLKAQLKDRKNSDNDFISLQSQISQLKDQLEYARKMHKSSELTIQSLEADKEELQEKLASAEKVSKTQVSGIPKASSLSSTFAKVSLDSPADNPLSDKAPVPPAATTKPLPDMSPVLNDVLKSALSAPDVPLNDSATITALESTTEDDLFPDDGWDDIAASFDAILVDKNKSNPPQAISNEDKPHTTQSMQPAAIPDLGILEDDRSQAELFGMTNFLNGGTRKTNASASDSKHPTRTTSHGLGAVPSSSILAQPKNTTKSSIPSIDAIRPIPSLKKPATEAPKVDTSFKPSPSWTGQKVSETPSGDSNTISQELVNALQKRARDVSQLNKSIPHEDGSTSKSGALEFNRSMSRSGVFSVTGSRASIDLHSDTEYFKALFDTYVESLKKHGEDTTKFTREQFISRMAKEKEVLLKSHKCKDIRFNVVEKNGKTSLKAVPLR